MESSETDFFTFRLHSVAGLLVIHVGKLNYIPNSHHHQLGIKDCQSLECKKQVFPSLKESVKYMYDFRIEKFP